MTKKIRYVFLFLFLFFLLNSTVFSSHIHNSGTESLPDLDVNKQGNTLFVGGTGPGNYTHIQDAINDASDGDTIYVYRGIYHENLKVDISLYLRGENRNTTIIDGDNKRDVVRLMADEVTLSGFTIQHGGSPLGYAGGIRLDDSSHSTITNNIIANNTNYGIWVLENTSSYTTISHNKISSNGDNDTGGFNIWLYQSSHNLILDNHIQNGKGYGLGICFWSTHTTVTGNYISGNHLEGIKSRYGFYNSICNNSIENNGYFGIRFLNASSDNLICNNTFIDNQPLDAFFTLTDAASSNQWRGNYWGQARTLPKPVWGCIRIPKINRDMIGFPWLSIDWHPAPEPCLF